MVTRTPKIDYESLEEQYDYVPSRSKMSSNRDPEINNRMATLKRHEDKLNRYRRMGIL